MVSPLNMVVLLLVMAVLGALAFLVRRGGTSRTIGLGLVIVLSWVVSVAVISAFWYERQGNLDLGLILLLALIPTIAIGVLTSHFSRHTGPA